MESAEEKEIFSSVSMIKILGNIRNEKYCKGVARGKGENTPSETEKIVVENGVISEGSIFSNKFSHKSNKIQFSIEFSSKIFKIFPICVFRPNARKINAWFVKFL